VCSSDLGSAIFADLVITDPGVREDVLAKRLPYRSVEIFNVDKPAIDSLALLDHEAPYLELPMLMVAGVAESSSERVFSRAHVANPWRSQSRTCGTEALVACFRRGRSAHVLTEDDMTATAEQTKPAVKMAADFPPKKGEDGAGDPAAAKAGAGEDGAPVDGEAPKGSPDVQAICKAIESGEITIADMEALYAAINARMGGQETTQQPAAAKTATAPTPGEAMSKETQTVEPEKFAALAGETAALKAENEAMRKRLDERDAEEKRREDVGVAMKRLAGRPLGADLEAKLVAFHREHGGKAFAAYVDSMVTTFGALPQRDDRGAAFAAPDAQTPEEAMAFQEAGTEAVAKTAKFAAEWDQLHERSMARWTKAEYVRANMARAGVTLKAKA